jgi:hypothetical protein
MENYLEHEKGCEPSGDFKSRDLPPAPVDNLKDGETCSSRQRHAQGAS